MWGCSELMMSSNLSNTWIHQRVWRLTSKIWKLNLNNTPVIHKQIIMCHNFIPKYFSYNIMFFLSHILTHTIVFPSQKKKNNANKRQSKSKSTWTHTYQQRIHFVLTNYSWAQDLPWSAVNVPNVHSLLEKTSSEGIYCNCKQLLGLHMFTHTFNPSTH